LVEQYQSPGKWRALRADSSNEKKFRSSLRDSKHLLFFLRIFAGKQKKINQIFFFWNGYSQSLPYK